MNVIKDIKSIKSSMKLWDGGAIVHPNGDIIYTNENHHVHRIDGPAHIHKSHSGEGIQQMWYVNNKRVYNWEEFQKESRISDEDLLVLVLKYGKI